jgi:hypothetical protein
MFSSYYNMFFLVCLFCSDLRQLFLWLLNSSLDDLLVWIRNEMLVESVATGNKQRADAFHTYDCFFNCRSV